MDGRFGNTFCMGSIVKWLVARRQDDVEKIVNSLVVSILRTWVISFDRLHGTLPRCNSPVQSDTGITPHSGSHDGQEKTLSEKIIFVSGVQIPQNSRLIVKLTAVFPILVPI